MSLEVTSGNGSGGMFAIGPLVKISPTASARMILTNDSGPCWKFRLLYRRKQGSKWQSLRKLGGRNEHDF